MTTQDMSLMDAVQKMRGPKRQQGQTHDFEERRAQAARIELVRDIISIQSVKSRRVGSGFGYVRISSFQSGHGKRTSQSANQLEADGAGLKGWYSI